MYRGKTLQKLLVRLVTGRPVTLLSGYERKREEMIGFTATPMYSQRRASTLLTVSLRTGPHARSWTPVTVLKFTARNQNLITMSVLYVSFMSTMNHCLTPGMVSGMRLGSYVWPSSLAASIWRMPVWITWKPSLGRRPRRRRF